MTCEQQKPTLQYVKSNLDDSMHTITVVNLAGVNNSFLGRPYLFPRECEIY